MKKLFDWEIPAWPICMWVEMFAERDGEQRLTKCSIEIKRDGVLIDKKWYSHYCSLDETKEQIMFHFWNVICDEVIKGGKHNAAAEALLRCGREYIQWFKEEVMDEYE